MIWLLYLAEFCFFLPLAERKRKLNRCSSYTKGIVNAVREEKRRRFFRAVIDYVPIVSFDVKGRRYEMPWGKSRNENEYQIGDECWILYNPADPHDVYTDDAFALLKANIMAGLGVFSLLLTLFCQLVL